MHIIGDKKAEKLANRQQEEHLKHQAEMRKKLSDWEIDNEVFVVPSIQISNTPTSITYHSILEFRRLNNEELNEYKNKINESIKTNSKIS